MPSPDAVLLAIALLRRVVPASQHPADDRETGAAWLDILDDATDGELHRAVRLHIRDAERGRWWPCPADLIRHMPRLLKADADAREALRMEAHEAEVARLMAELDARLLTDGAS